MLALPAVLGAFLLRRFRWIVPVLALAVPLLLWLTTAAGRHDPYFLAMIPAAALWAWAGRHFGLLRDRRGLGKAGGDS